MLTGTQTPGELIKRNEFGYMMKHKYMLGLQKTTTTENVF